MVLPMASNEIVPSLLLNSPTTDISSIRDGIDCFNQELPLSPMVLVTTNSARSTTSTRFSKRKHSIIHGSGIRKAFARKSIPSIELTMGDISYRLRMRKFLNTRLGLISDIMCFLSVLGIALMIVDNELTFNLVNNSDTKTSWLIKPMISATTIVLLGLIFYYHYLDLKLYAVQNSLEDFRVGLTKTKISLIAIEILICAIHPVPHSTLQLSSQNLTLNSSNSNSLTYIAIDVALGLPMFLRLYLFGRSIMFHSHLVRNISLRSMSYLNQVSMDFFFLIKTYLEQWPARCLLTMCTIVFLIGSWSLRACDYRSTGEHLAILDAMWLFIITFTTVGYGDIYPSSYCGRGIATMIGLVGLLSSALLISVFARKLLLTREEKYVHAFVLNTELAKEHQNQAANVIKFAIKVWYFKRKNKPMFIRHLRAQQTLFQSIYRFQEIKKQQRNSADNCAGLHEIITMQRNANAQHDETIQQMTEMKCDMKIIEEKLNNMTHGMNDLQATLNMLLNK